MVLAVLVAITAASFAQNRPRAREAGIVVGVLSPGPDNGITDVKGVLVGHATLYHPDSVCTGVTAILPHGGNMFQDKVPAAVYVGNGFGKLTGVTQIRELGLLETPIILTNTLSVGTALQSLVSYILDLPGNERVRSVNGVAGETNDGWLNDIRGLHIDKEHIIAAIKAASTNPVEEGSVGAGTGTTCLGFKGGIGTSSRRLPKGMGSWTVGVLVQTNFGGILRINGAPVGRELGRYSFKRELESPEEGSCMIVIATDAPLLSRNLERLASRAVLGLARCGGFCSNGSGDYVISFSTYPQNRSPYQTSGALEDKSTLRNEEMSSLFLAAVEATEEAILNSLFKATEVQGFHGHTTGILPIEKAISICRKYNALNWDQSLPPGKTK